jgi:hypothetical protein
MTQGLFKKLQDEIARQPLNEGLKDNVNRQVILNLIRKLNIFIDTLDISAYLSNDSQGIFELGFIENMCTWSMNELADKFPVCLV